MPAVEVKPPAKSLVGRAMDVHRWDMLPSSGDDWHIHHTGALDLRTRNLHILNCSGQPKGTSSGFSAIPRNSGWE